MVPATDRDRVAGAAGSMTYMSNTGDNMSTQSRKRLGGDDELAPLAAAALSASPVPEEVVIAPELPPPVIPGSEVVTISQPLGPRQLLSGLSADCPRGKRPLGGGVRSSREMVRVFSSGPNSGTSPTAWVVGVQNTSISFTITVIVYAVCATIEES